MKPLVSTVCEPCVVKNPAIAQHWDSTSQSPDAIRSINFCLNGVDPWLTADDKPGELWEQCLPALSLGIEDTIVHLDLEC